MLELAKNVMTSLLLRLSVEDSTKCHARHILKGALLSPYVTGRYIRMGCDTVLFHRSPQIEASWNSIQAERSGFIKKNWLTQPC